MKMMTGEGKQGRLSINGDTLREIVKRKRMLRTRPTIQYGEKLGGSVLVVASLSCPKSKSCAMIIMATKN